MFKLPDDGKRVYDSDIMRNNFEQHTNNSVVWCENHQTLIEIFCGKIFFDLLLVW